MNNQIIKENGITEVFYEIDNGEYIQFDMTLQMQILFDDAIKFISLTDS